MVVTTMEAPGRGPSIRLLAGGAVIAVLAVVLAENLGAGLLYEILLRLPGIDKAMHWVQYLVIFFVFWWAAGALKLRPWTRIALAVGGGLAVGVMDETVQRQLAQRTFELEDLAVDAAALSAGAAIVAPVRRALTVLGVALSLLVTGVFARDTYTRLAHYNRGLLAERQHDMRTARDEYRLALRAGHASPGLYNSLSWVEIESGDGSVADAVHYGELALAARPDDGDYLDTYGWALHHAGRTREALEALERARRLKPDIYSVEYHLGVVLQALARPCEAKAAYERQVRAFPDSVEARRAAQALPTVGCAAGGPGSGR